MKRTKTLLALLALVLAMGMSSYAQKPGYTRYVITKSIDNGNVRDAAGGGQGYWIKFEGDLIWLDMGFGSQSRFVYNTTRNDGNKLYYSSAWNHGTMNQGSGWVTSYDSWLLVSPDGNTINWMQNNGNRGQVLKKQTANDVGGMIE